MWNFATISRLNFQALQRAERRAAGTLPCQEIQRKERLQRQRQRRQAELPRKWRRKGKKAYDKRITDQVAAAIKKQCKEEKVDQEKETEELAELVR